MCKDRLSKYILSEWLHSFIADGGGTGGLRLVAMTQVVSGTNTGLRSLNS